MILKKEFWVFIPARSGSKSITNKNIKLIKKNLYWYIRLRSPKKLKLQKKLFSQATLKNISKLRENILIKIVNFIKEIKKCPAT